MFICKDVSQNYVLASYWERRQFHLVVKEVLPNGDLRQHSAKAYTMDAAQALMLDFSDGPVAIHGVQFDRHDAAAIADRIAEKLNKDSGPESRIRPELWN